MVIGMPLSKAITSIVTGMLILNWVAEGGFAEKFSLLKRQKGLLLLLSVFGIYLLGLLWTSSLKWGLADVRIQLPMLVLPLVIGTSARLNYVQVKFILYTFSLAVVVASFCSIWVLMGFSGVHIHDPREMSLFISHIRFSLLINIAIFSLGWYLFHDKKMSTTWKILLLLTIIWLGVFLIILRSATGWVVFFVVSMLVIFKKLLQIRKMSLRLSFMAGFILIFTLPVVYTFYVVNQFYTFEKIPQNLMQEKTKLGNPYFNDLKNKEVENGHYTFLYMSEDELREAWNKRSKIEYDSTSRYGYNKFVLIRYLTSKGFRKDAEGVEKLTESDIKNIENGIANYRFAGSFSFYKRIYQIIWEINSYKNGGDPSGHSVTQRLEYYRMALQIISKDIWFGKGTGGYYKAYEEQYNQSRFFQRGEYRQRSHNMFLSYWIDFGLAGMLYICFSLIAPVFIERKTKSFLLITFLLIVFLSFINEDTLNNHDAISFFAFFYPLFLYSNHEKSGAELFKQESII